MRKGKGHDFERALMEGDAKVAVVQSVKNRVVTTPRNAVEDKPLNGFWNECNHVHSHVKIDAVTIGDLRLGVKGGSSVAQEPTRQPAIEQIDHLGRLAELPGEKRVGGEDPQCPALAAIAEKIAERAIK